MWNLNIENIAGIRSGSTTIMDGLNVVQASNFRGKSSLIASIQTAMGATGHYEDHPLTEGAESGSITLETPDETHSVDIERDGRGYNSRSGNPYLSDELDQKTARLFAFLGENNPIRTAVRNGDDLTEYLQQPLNIDEIDRKIEKLKNKREELETELRQARDAADRLPSVQQDVTQLEADLEELRDRKDELEEVSQSKNEAERLSDKISDKQSELKNKEREIKRLESSIEHRKEQIEEKKQELENLEVPEVPTLSDLDEKKERVSSLEASISLFEDLYRANKNALESDDLDRLSNIERTLSGDKIECWICGDVASKEHMQSRIEQINERASELREEREELNEEINEFEDKKRQAKKRQRRHDELENKIAEHRQTIQDQEPRLEQLKEEQSSLENEISQLSTELSDLQEDYNDELTDLKTEIRDKERQLKRRRNELEQLDEQKAEVDELDTKTVGLTEQIKELRNKKTETQQQLREEFDTAIDDIITRYAPGFETARLNTITNPEGDIVEFELIIAREGRETTVDALSEGEVELIGVAAALAGYRVYDVDEIVPCIVIDAISQLASEHLRELINYIEDTADIIVTTAYPEAGDFEGQTIDPSAWDVVSDQTASAA